MVRPNLVHYMDSSMVGFQPPVVWADRDLVKGVIGRWKFKDQIVFFRKITRKISKLLWRGFPLARVCSPYLQKILNRVPERIAVCHHFEEVGFHFYFVV